MRENLKILKDQSERKKVAIFVDVRKVHKKWSIFCFYGKFWIVVVFEITACEVGDLKLCVLQRKHVPDSSVYWENNSKSLKFRKVAEIFPLSEYQ